MYFEIPEANFNIFMKKTEAVFRKCEKLGCACNLMVHDPIYKEMDIMVETEEYGYPVSKFIKMTVKMFPVDITGVAIIEGWQFIGMIEHLPSGNIIKTLGEELPKEYYHCEPHCDHCGRDRGRKFTYVVRNKDGEYKQLGKSCVKLYTHGLSAENIARYFSYLSSLEKCTDTGKITRHECFISSKELLKIAVAIVRQYGYIKYQPHNPNIIATSSLVDAVVWMKEGCNISPRDKEMLEHVNFDADGIDDEVDDIVKWIKKHEETTSWIVNLKTIFNSEYVSFKNKNIAISVIPCFYKEKEVEKEIAAEAKASQYVGDIGERVRVYVMEFSIIAGWETNYGYTAVYKFVDDQQNVLTWKTTVDISSRIQDWEQQQFTQLGHKPKYEMYVSGTVKRHFEYRDIHQTELQRCKISFELTEEKE